MSFPQTSPRLQGAHLQAGYDTRRVLDDVSLDVEAGRLTMLLGPNGSGKSTLLKTLARTLRPTGGRVVLDGQDIQRRPTRAVARRLGILPQGPDAPEGLTVRQLVAMGRFPHQHFLKPQAREDALAIDEAMALADVDQFAARPVESLSGGQRQRCWIAMVLAQQTELILLDEPTTFLDLKVQVDLLDLLAELAHVHGRTLLVVMHDLNLAAAYADTLVMMRDGRIHYQGTPEEVFTADTLKAVFDLEARVMSVPGAAHPVCIPATGREHAGTLGEVAP
ncbi:ABC transporter ATP-binding protein [Halomonas sabkhae]|uniref:ABC transporter ATP-binding protein n=1 Tax=Halomonas sabkhae TaxID=626223 RepID=UPI0025B57D59|nr:ABC transporter ATP-binding protein [Halomonas sabkhae]MDN3525855.1 ABC transporter ATP-binding protein [Halomonas sabkhae]